jgi:hypothetical protein
MSTQGLRSVATLAEEARVTFREVYDAVPTLIPYDLPPAIAQSLDIYNSIEILPASLKLPSASELEARIKDGIGGPIAALTDKARPYVESVEKLLNDVLTYSTKAADLLEDATAKGQELLSSLDWLIG